METAINLTDLEINSKFKMSRSDNYRTLLEKNSKIFDGKSYSKIQCIGSELSGIDFQSISTDEISYIPDNTEVLINN